jgi:hypothetical protein
MPAAMENMNDVFITDHGSSRDSRNRAFRVRRASPGFGLVFVDSLSAPDFAAATAAVAAAAVAAPTAGNTPVFGPPGGAAGAGIGPGPVVRAVGWSAPDGGPSARWPEAGGAAILPPGDAGGAALSKGIAPLLESDVPLESVRVGSAAGAAPGGRSLVVAAVAPEPEPLLDGAVGTGLGTVGTELVGGAAARWATGGCCAGSGLVARPRRSFQDRFGPGAAGGSQTGTAGRRLGCCSPPVGIPAGGGMAPTVGGAEGCAAAGRAPLGWPGAASGLAGGV